jgi:tRNA1Val (adenine37-N6)-methyltransferase
MRDKRHFDFKKFTIWHEHSTLKVGTDSVLLGAWAELKEARLILDVGAGNGTIALMAAQRSSDDSRIDAVEIEERDAMQADENFKRSPWPHKIQIHRSSIQKFCPEKKYDVIISNPPYFSNSLSPPDSRRHQARHTITLSHEDLIQAALRLLTESGRLNVILPFEEGLKFVELSERTGLYCSRQFSFRTRAEKKIERWLLEFYRVKKPVETGEILLYKSGDFWDETYRDLTKDFYTKI